MWSLSTLACGYALSYAVLGVAGWLPDRALLTAPPLHCVRSRLRALLFESPAGMNARTRGLLALRTLSLFLWQPLWLGLWVADEVLFPAYRTTPLTAPVFIVGGFRTGSTSLHRALSLDEARWVTPRFFELAFPFLVVQVSAWHARVRACVRTRACGVWRARDRV